MNNISRSSTFLLAWAVHIFTASGLIFGFLACLAIQEKNWPNALYCLLIALIIDSFDGTLARRLNVKKVLPGIDGRMLDYVVDFVNFVFIPALFIYSAIELPNSARLFLIILIIMASCYHYANLNAVSDSTHFVGFPAFWNIVAYYLFVLDLPSLTNAIVITCVVLIHFLPIRFLYLSHFFRSTRIALPLTLIWLTVTALVLIGYPNFNQYLVYLSLSLAFIYICLSNSTTLFRHKTD